jgi:UBX domain-containing protein 1
MNEDRTVGELREYISLSRPNLAATPFDLLTTFPSKVLEDDGVTLKSAGLLNAAVMLRLKK